MRVIDLFAGCGGLSHGFNSEGFIIDKAVELDPVAANTYKKNHPTVEVIVDDIANIDNSGLFKKGDAEVIIGGPPCQGFSMAGTRNRQGFIDDPRNYLFKHYFNVVRDVKPKAFVMENVKGMLTMQNGKIFNEVISVFSNKELLGSAPYHLHYFIIKTDEFGIPQKRERLIIIGTLEEGVDIQKVKEETKKKLEIKYPTFFDKVTLEDAIASLPEPNKTGEVENPCPKTDYEKYLFRKVDKLTNHKESNHSDLAVQRMRQVKNGENFTALDETIRSVHSGSYGRLSWSEQASTITTRFDTPAGGRFIHPDKDRTLTPREAARIQSFPDDFKFYGPKRAISRQIGNAVPPKVSTFLALLIKGVIAKG